MSDATTCRSCGATIWWAITPKGRRMPVDPPGLRTDPNVSVWRDATGVLRTGSAAPDGWPVHDTTSHFATCPQADEHRRPR